MTTPPSDPGRDLGRAAGQAGSPAGQAGSPADLGAQGAARAETADRVVNRRLGWVLLLAGLVGLAASGMLLVEKIALLADSAYVPSCSINPILSCGSIMTTLQAELLGFPNPVLGVAGFPFVAGTGGAVLAGARFARWYWLTLWACSAAALGLVHWLIVQSLYRIGALCPYCMVVWVVTIIVFVTLTARAVAGRLGGWGSRLARYAPSITVAWLGVILVLIAVRFRDYWATLLTQPASFHTETPPVGLSATAGPRRLLVAAAPPSGGLGPLGWMAIGAGLYAALLAGVWLVQRRRRRSHVADGPGSDRQPDADG